MISDKDKKLRETLLSMFIDDEHARKHGNYYIVNCPQCHQREAYAYMDDMRHFLEGSGKGFIIHCNRKNNCGFVGKVDLFERYADSIPANYIPRDLKKITTYEVTGACLVPLPLQHFLEAQCLMSPIDYPLSHFEKKPYLPNSKNPDDIVGTCKDFLYRGIHYSTLYSNGLLDLHGKDLHQRLVDYVNDPNHGALFATDPTIWNDILKTTKIYIDRNMIFPIYHPFAKSEVFASAVDSDLQQAPRLDRLVFRSSFKDMGKMKEIQYKLYDNAIDIFNARNLFDDAITFFHEGIYDSLSTTDVYNYRNPQHLNFNSVGLTGVGKYAQATNLLNEYKANVDPKKTFVIFFDNDAAGKEQTIALKKELNASKRRCVYISYDKNFKYKDANEWYQADPADYAQTIQNIVQDVQKHKTIEEFRVSSSPLQQDIAL